MDTTNNTTNETAATAGTAAAALVAEWAAERLAAEPERNRAEQAELWLAKWEPWVRGIIETRRLEGVEASAIADAEWMLDTIIARRAQLKSAAENAARDAELLARFQDLQPFERFVAREAWAFSA